MEFEPTKFRAQHPMVVFLVILLIFLIPIILAWGLLHRGHSLPRETTNYGTLIRPPLQFSKLVFYDVNGKVVKAKHFYGKWMMLYVHPKDSCDRSCEKHLYDMRQIRLATGKHMDSVLRGIIIFRNGEHKAHIGKLVRRRYPDTAVLTTSAEQFKQFISRLSYTKQVMTAGYYFLIDSHGNVMMSYPLNIRRSAMFKDLMHLLKVNQ